MCILLIVPTPRAINIISGNAKSRCAEARDRLGKLLAVGVVALIFCHVFVNIGMHLRVMPVTGIPLPLLSYGGSSVLSSLIAIAVLQNVQLHKKSY